MIWRIWIGFFLFIGRRRETPVLECAGDVGSHGF